MTGAQFLDLLMFRLGNRTDTTLRTALVLEANAKIADMQGAPFLPWFLKGDDSTATTAAGTEYASLPANFLRLDADWGGVYFLDTTRSEPDQWVKLKKIPYDQMKAKFVDTEQSSPQAFDIMDGRIYIRPIPDAIYSLRFVGYFGDTTAVADSAATNEWLTNAADWLLAEVGYAVTSMAMQDTESAVVFDKARAEAKTRVMVEGHARQFDGDDYQMGDD
jgi:hypothetical protein